MSSNKVRSSLDFLSKKRELINKISGVKDKEEKLNKLDEVEKILKSKVKGK